MSELLRKSLQDAKRKRTEDSNLSVMFQEEAIQQELDKRGLKGMARLTAARQLLVSGFGADRVRNGKVTTPGSFLRFGSTG